MELNKMSELSMIVEEKELRIKTLVEMNKSLDYEITEYLRVMLDTIANINARRQVIVENQTEIETLKTNLEEYEALRQ